MTFTLDLPPNVENAYLAHARAKGLPVEAVVREVLIATQPKPVTHTVFEEPPVAMLDERIAGARIPAAIPAKESRSEVRFFRGSTY